MRVAKKIGGLFGVLVGGGVILSLMTGRVAPWVYSVPTAKIAAFVVGTGMMLVGALLAGERN